MKKNVLLILFILFSICIDAQIQRNFWGLKLGVSTKKEVMNHFKAKKIPVSFEDGVLVVKDVHFGGYTWEDCRIEFYKNKFVAIFLSSANALNSKEYLDSRWEYLVVRLDSKYGKFLESHEEDNNKHSKVYSDTITTVNIVYNYSDGLWYQSLIYIDDAFMKDLILTSSDEL